MRVFIPVFFNAPFGGLHAHVRAQCAALRRAGNKVTVLCKPGPFAEILQRDSVEILSTDFDDLEAAIGLALSAGPFDLIHAHPFASRHVGLAVANATDVPLVVTFHREYVDDLNGWHDSADAIVAVSPAIRDYLWGQTDVDPTKLLMIPNGVDLSVFTSAADGQERVSSDGAPSIETCGRSRQAICFASRLDVDKLFALEAIKDCWRRCAETRAFTIEWWIAGEGSERKSMEQEAAKLNDAAGRELVRFHGWLDDASLAKLYDTADLTIGPGRCVPESMACGTPALAIGKASYVGLIEARRFVAGLHTNFGECYQEDGGCASGAMFNDIDRVIYDRELLWRLGQSSVALIRAYFDQNRIDSQLLALYGTLMDAGKRWRQTCTTGTPLEIAEKTWSFPDTVNSAALSKYWVKRETPRKLDLSIEEDDTLVAALNFATEEKGYLALGEGAFENPSSLAAELRLLPNSDYQLKIRLLSLSGAARCQIFLIEYDDRERLRHSHVQLREGDNTLRHHTSPQAQSYRLALRFSSCGNARLAPIELSRVTTLPQSPPAQPRTPARRRDLVPYGRWGGENLVFIIGPPRSGTTWVLNTLQAHLDVVAATLENLDVRLRPHASVETNIFNSDRPFTDAQIKRKFYDCAQRHSGQVIVEKTPIHLLFVDRMRRIFPECALILTNRDGRDSVSSLVRVGRDPNAWWEGAPESVEAATKLWRNYAWASSRCQAVHFPLMFSYEEAITDPEASFSILITRLGLSIEPLPSCLERGHDRSAVPFPGYFGKGRPGSWRDMLQPQELEDFNRIGGAENAALGYPTD